SVVLGTASKSRHSRQGWRRMAGRISDVLWKQCRRFVEHFEPKGVVLAGLSASGAEPLTKYQIERFKASLLALEPAEQGCRQGTGKGYENCPPARNERPVIFPRPRCRLKPNEGAGSKRRVAGVTFRL